MTSIDYLVKVTEINERQMNPYSETFCLDELMEEMCFYVKQELEKKNKLNVGVKMITNSRFEKCWINTDRVRLKQIFTILLDRAVKNTDKGYIFYGFHTSVSNNINFSVDDTGIGAVNGHDVDLSIVQGLVQQFGGEMEIRSTIDAGTAIRFNIVCTPCNLHEN